MIQGRPPTPLMKITSILCSLSLLTSAATAQTYQFDGDLATPGIQNGNGVWSTSSTDPANLRWLKDGIYSAWDNSGLAIAEFGNATSVNGGAITLSEEIKLAGMTFNTLGAPLGTLAHSFTGGTLNFGTGGIINIGNAASGGGTGNQWITFTSLLKGQDLTFQKSAGSAIGFARISSINPELTGTLTIKSAPGATSGIYLSVGSPNFLPSLSRIDVQTYSTFNPTGTGTYPIPMSLAGIGGSNYGAVRVDPSNATFSGAWTLTADARVHTHINTVNTLISSAIGETGGSWSFNRTAYLPTAPTTGALTATYTGASTYTGATIFGRSIGVLNTTESIGTEGGVNILDFSAATAPNSNILYNGQTPGQLQLIGGLATPTVLRVQGAARETNSQSFGGLSVQQSATSIVAASGFNGTVNVNLGAMTRLGDGVVSITAPISGTITASIGGSTEGLVGTWATYRSADGKTAGWAGLTNGVMGVFKGDLIFEDDISVNTLSGYTPQSHLQISDMTYGTVSFDASQNEIGTISMTDIYSLRMVDFNGQSLRMGANGGIQMTPEAQSLVIGAAGDGSTITSGGMNNATDQLTLTNLSNAGILIVNSIINNNGTGVTSLNINGTGRVRLMGNNTYTGVTVVNGGVLEVRTNTALGSTLATAGTKVMSGASLNVAGNITLGETLQINGQGINLDGALRNLSGVNTITPSVRLQSGTRIASDSGTLILAGGFSAQASALTYIFSGAGNIEVRGPIVATSGTLTKEGSGTLILSGTSTAVGATTVTNGTLHLNFDGTGAPAANILYTTTAGPLVLSGGALRVTGKTDGTSSQTFSAITLNSGSSRISSTATGTGSADIVLGAITRNAGATMRFDVPTSGAIKTTSGSNNALVTGTGGIAYATVGLNEWAATGTAVSGVYSIVPLSSISGGYTASTASGLSGNADIASTVTATSLSGNTTISSLRFNQPQATTITQDTSTQVLATGGILVTPNVGANASAIRGGSIRAATGSNELVIFQNNAAAPLTISSRILNANSGTNLTKAGPGTLVLEYASAYAAGDMTGGVRIQDGTLQLSKTVATGISYYLYASTTFSLGSGPNSGRLVLGDSTNNYAVTAYGGLRTEGSGTGNALVSNTTGLGTFLHYVSSVMDFRTGMIGGTGPNENNLNLQISLGTLQLGPANTYKGKTSLLQNTIEVTTLADRGLPSSLGTGDYNTTTHVIDIATATTSTLNYPVVATLRYIGDTDSVTNRPLNLVNTGTPTTVISTTAVLENTGTGTVKFTAPFTAAGTNPSQRVLRLSGTNTGANEIVSFMDASASILGRVEKTGLGSWTMTGPSTYSGGTLVDAGTLLVSNTTGSATGTGDVVVSSNATFGGIGRVAPAVNKNISVVGGVLQVGMELPGLIDSAGGGVLTLETSGTGTLSLTAGAILAFDLFSGAGLGDNTSTSTAADLAAILGTMSVSSDTVIRVSNPTGMTAWAANDKWRLFDWSGLSGTVLGTVTNYDLPVLPEGLAWNTSDLFNTGYLSIINTVVVPEPSRALFVGLGAVLILSRRRRIGHA